MKDPQVLPDDVGGRVLFDIGDEQYRNLVQRENKAVSAPKRSDLLGNIVMVEPVKKVRDRNALKSVRPFTRFTRNGMIWQDGSERQIDTVIWCTGFKLALDHLLSLRVVNETSRVETEAAHIR